MQKTTKHHLFLCAAAVLLVVLITAFFYYRAHPITRQEISIDLSIGDYVGVNADQDALHFGTLLPGASAERSLVLRADEYPITVQLIVQDLPFVVAEETDFVLAQGESKSVRFFARPDRQLEKKTYRGTLLILTKRL